MLSLNACAVPPSSIVHHVTSATATPIVPAPQNGSIFQNASFRPLVADYRPRVVGDMLTIDIRENVSADKTNAASDKKSQSILASLDSLFGISLSNMDVSESSTIQSDQKAAGKSSYNFLGKIAVTVIEVLPNGNLLVSGEKQIGLDKGAEFIRLSGVVAPILIEPDNSISSSKLADARVEYRTNSQIDEAELLKSLNRIFSAVLLL